MVTRENFPSVRIIIHGQRHFNRRNFEYNNHGARSKKRYLFDILLEYLDNGGGTVVNLQEEEKKKKKRSCGQLERFEASGE